MENTVDNSFEAMVSSLVDNFDAPRGTKAAYTGGSDVPMTKAGHQIICSALPKKMPTPCRVDQVWLIRVDAKDPMIFPVNLITCLPSGNESMTNDTLKLPTFTPVMDNMMVGDCAIVGPYARPTRVSSNMAEWNKRGERKNKIKQHQVMLMEPPKEINGEKFPERVTCLYLIERVE